MEARNLLNLVGFVPNNSAGPTDRLRVRRADRQTDTDLRNRFAVFARAPYAGSGHRCIRSLKIAEVIRLAQQP